MENDELREALIVASILADENPCRMSRITRSMLGGALKALISNDYAKGMNQDSVARYLGVTARTIQRWQKDDGFPKPKNMGDGTISYDPMEVVKWKRDHCF